jgi:uncharacterized protein YbaR (Trm112 family)
MIEKTLLEILCSPLSHGALRLADSAELREINGQIHQRLVRNRDGAVLDLGLDGALVCQSEGMCYPVRDALPVLIPGEAFEWPKRS